MGRIVEALKRFTRRLAAGGTAVLLAVGLFLAYWVGVALTRLFAEVFSRSFLGRGRKAQESYWRPAEGYGTAPTDVADQS
jgi:hypothetical protein